MEHFIELDGKILLWIQEHLRTDLMTIVMSAVTRLGNRGLICIAFAVLFLVFRKTRKMGFALSMGLILNLLLVNVFLKNAFNRIRPYEVVDGLRCLIPAPSDASFPSGHASHAFVAVAVIWMMTNRKYGIIALIVGLLISWSRLYLGAHYPSDVLTGIFIGTIVGVVSVLAVKALDKKWSSRNVNVSNKVEDN